MAWEDYWKTVVDRNNPYWESDGEGGGQWAYPESTVWNTASGYASPEDYLVKTRGIPAWAASYVDKAGSGGQAHNMSGKVDAAGFVLPNAYGGQRGTGNGAVDLGWIPDENNNFATGESFRQALQQQTGGGATIPLADAQKAWENGRFRENGISFDDYLKRQYQNARVVDVPGVGQVVASDGQNSFDWGLARDGGIGEFLSDGLKFAGVMGAGMGIANLISGGMSAASGALDAASLSGIESPASWGNLGELTSMGEAAAAEAATAGAGAQAAQTGIPTMPNPGAPVQTLSELTGAQQAAAGLPTIPTMPNPGQAVATLPEQVAAAGASGAGAAAASGGLGSTLLDAAGKAVTNAATGAVVNAIAGGSGAGSPTNTARLDAAGNAIDAAVGKLPTEEEAAGRAHADVTQAFDVQRKNFLRNLQSYGINPNSGRFGGANLKFNLQEGKTDALSQNMARQGVRNASLGTAATLAGLNQGLTQTQALLDAQNFARQQAVQNQVRSGLAPLVSAAAPAISKTVSSWFDLPTGAQAAQQGVKVDPTVFDQFDADLVSA